MSNKLLINYNDALIYESDLALLADPSAWLNSDCIHFQLTRLSVLQKERRLGEGRSKEGNDCLYDEDLFLDPAVVSFLMHQMDEEDEDEITDLNRAWKLPCHDDNSSQSSLKKNRTKRVFVPINDQYASSRSAFATPGGGSHWSFLLWVITLSTSESNEISSKYFHFDSSRGYNAFAAKAVSRKLQTVLSNGDGDCSIVECKTPQQNNGYDCGVFMLGFAQALAFKSAGGSTADYEATIQSYFDDMGGQKDFARGLRKQIGDDIRQLVSQKHKKRKEG